MGSAYDFCVAGMAWNRTILPGDWKCGWTCGLFAYFIGDSAICSRIYRVPYFKKVFCTGECIPCGNCDSGLFAEGNPESGIWIAGDALCYSHIRIDL